MMKVFTAAGVVLTLAGLIAGCWPAGDVAARSRRLVPASAYERRELVVVVDWPATTVRDAAGTSVSVTSVLRAAGYWVRSGREFITRERLAVAGVLVVSGAPDDPRTATLVRRWVDAGGTMLVLTGAHGASSERPQGAGRVVVLDPAAFTGADMVARVLEAIK